MASADGWPCPACTLVNASAAEQCAACTEPRPARAAAAPAGCGGGGGGGGGGGSPTSAPRQLAISALTSRVGVLVELRDGSGAGGVVCAAPRTHAAVRASLVLLALQLAPLLRLAEAAGLLPAGTRLARLHCFSATECGSGKRRALRLEPVRGVGGARRSPDARLARSGLCARRRGGAARQDAPHPQSRQPHGLCLKSR